MHRQKGAEDRGERLHYAHAGGHTQQPSRKPQAERLQQKDAQQVGRARADCLENGEHVHALLKM